MPGGRPRVWSRGRIMGAALTWRAVHGRKPTSNDWEASTPGYPTTQTVSNYFGSWSAMYRALGWEPNPPGPRVAVAQRTC